MRGKGKFHAKKGRREKYIAFKNKKSATKKEN
ncbi:MAG: hypothetical protein QG594_1749 [Bacteroidota bacterium]|nr:hypothetical protein [Bacteroidota bacterium]